MMLSIAKQIVTLIGASSCSTFLSESTPLSYIQKCLEEMHHGTVVFVIDNHQGHQTEVRLNIEFRMKCTDRAQAGQHAQFAMECRPTLAWSSGGAWPESTMKIARGLMEISCLMTLLQNMEWGK